MNSGKITVFVTASSTEEARSIARGVLEKRLAACANILSGVESHYWWDGALQTEKEVMIIMKTVSGLFNELEAEVRRLHSYDVPEIIALPVSEGSPPYLGWIEEETSLIPGKEDTDR